MRFYRTGRGTRIAFTVLWSILGVFWVDVLLGRAHRQWMAVVWILLPSIQLLTLWTDYWTVDADGIAQHSFFYRRFYHAEDMRYAGPVRAPRYRWALKKSLEIEMRSGTYPRYVNVADRPGFLHELRRIAPGAEIVD